TFEHLRRKRTFTDAGCVSTNDTKHAAQAMGREAGAGDRAARHGGRGSNKRISAVVYVEQRRLRAFEQDRLSFACRDIEEVGRVGDEWPKSLRQHRHLFKDLVGVERLTAVR